jgi:protein-tyrosine phosphatase
MYSVFNSGAAKLYILSRPRGGDWLEDEIKRLRYSGVEVLVSLLTLEENRELDLQQEAELAAKHAITFLSFPIPDRQVPQNMSAAFEFFKKLARYIQTEQKNVAVHCRMGIGRSALVAAATMVLLGHHPDEAFDLIAHHRGATVPDTAEQREWVASFAEYVWQNRPVKNFAKEKE